MRLPAALLTRAGLALLLVGSVPAFPAALPEPAPRIVVLTITGKVEAGPGSRLDLTLEDLERLGLSSLTTTTPFTQDPVRFSGILLRDLLRAVRAHGDTIHATALNDYMIDIPVTDVTTYEVLLATRIDGKTLSIREKGPLWVVYPWSQHKELNSPLYGARSIWQVFMLEIR